MTEAANERPLEDLNPDEPGRYLDDIDAMSLEELMGLRDAALFCAAAMAARLAALKQAEGRAG